MRKFLTNGDASTYLAAITHALGPEIPLKILSKSGCRGEHTQHWIDVAVLNDGFVDPMNPYPCIYILSPEG